MGDISTGERPVGADRLVQEGRSAAPIVQAWLVCA
jgi:hypothetical protein